MKTMLRNVRHISRIFFFLFYVVYAFTPVNMYAVTGYNGRSSYLLHPNKHDSSDIIWINILFLPGDGFEAPFAGVRISDNVKQDADVVLVKKRRAIFREQFDGRPLFETKSMPADSLERTSARFLEYATTRDSLAREIDGCLPLNSGLSPPSHIS